MIKGVNFKTLESKTITNVKYGSEHTPSCGSYGAMTIECSDGSKFVIWNSLGEVNLSQITKELYENRT